MITDHWSAFDLISNCPVGQDDSNIREEDVGMCFSFQAFALTAFIALLPLKRALARRVDTSSIEVT